MYIETDSNITLVNSISFNSQGITYLVTSSSTVKVIPNKNKQYSGTIIIPTTVQYHHINYKVTEISKTAFRNNKKITAIHISKHITTIKAFTFSKCENLKMITLPNSISSIEKYAFSFSGLTNFNFPTGITKIESYLFMGCEKLKSVTIPNNIKTIENYSFSWCTKLTSIICDLKLPLTIHSDVFTGNHTNACTLKVATSCLSKYKKTHVWKSFNVIGNHTKLNTPSLVIQNNMSVYPKSVQNKLFIEFYKSNEALIEIFNENGQVVLHQTKTKTQNSINTSNLPMGMYWVKLTSNQGTTTKKITKQ